MAEDSYPKGAASERPLGEAQWKNIMVSQGRGIVDMGGTPYWLTSRDSVTDTVTIGVDSKHGFNAALLDGFLHWMDTPKTLSVPPVSADTVYEIGLVYDPAQHNAATGPITLTAWKAPGTTTGGVSRLTLWRITRKANVALGSSPYEEVRPRVSPLITVTRKTDLPTNSLVLSDTIAVVREEGALYRSAVSSGTVQWIGPIGGSTDISEATHLVVPGALVRRWDGNGTIHMPTPLAPNDAANKSYVDDRVNTVGSGAVNAGELVRRGNDGNFLVPSSPTNSSHPASKSYVDGKTWSASDITSGTLNYARVAGSTPAWGYTVGGTYSTLAVQSDGRLGKWSSTERHKTNIVPFEADPRELLKPGAYRFNRINPDGTVNPRVEIGTIAERSAPHIPELVEWGPDTIDEAGRPETEDRIQGWTYMTWTAVQQYLHQWQTTRVDDLEQENAELREALGGVLTRLEALEGKEG